MSLKGQPQQPAAAASRLVSECWWGQAVAPDCFLTAQQNAILTEAQLSSQPRLSGTADHQAQPTPVVHRQQHCIGQSAATGRPPPCCSCLHTMPRTCWLSVCFTAGVRCWCYWATGRSCAQVNGAAGCQRGRAGRDSPGVADEPSQQYSTQTQQYSRTRQSGSTTCATGRGKAAVQLAQRGEAKRQYTRHSSTAGRDTAASCRGQACTSQGGGWLAARSRSM